MFVYERHNSKEGRHISGVWNLCMVRTHCCNIDAPFHVQEGYKKGTHWDSYRRYKKANQSFCLYFHLRTGLFAKCTTLRPAPHIRCLKPLEGENSLLQQSNVLQRNYKESTSWDIHRRCKKINSING